MTITAKPGATASVADTVSVDGNAVNLSGVSSSSVTTTVTK